MYTYFFQKEIKPDKLQDEIVQSGLSSISYIETVDINVVVHFNIELNQEEQNLLHEIISNHSAETSEDIVNKKIQDAMEFGQVLIVKFATSNVLMGITQQGLTGSVTDYLHKLSHYTSTGSLYQAISEIERLISLGIPPQFFPFITEERLNQYKLEIVEYLNG